MKNQLKLARRATFLIVFYSAISCFAQGSLTPPGAPAPTMKTLSQIEPRTPISALPTNITASGSYYVSTNLTGTASNPGITVSTNDVTIDLNGCTLTGVSSALAGISMSGSHSNLVVKNGAIENWPGNGIDSSAGNQNSFMNVKVLACLIGINAGNYDSIQGCSINGSLLFGCSLANNCVIKDSNISNSGARGVVASAQDEIVDCFIANNSVTGIFLNSTNCRVDGNYLLGNGNVGLEITAGNTGNIVVRNTASANPTNYVVQAGNDIGPIGAAASSSSPWANISN